MPGKFDIEFVERKIKKLNCSYELKQRQEMVMKRLDLILLMLFIY